MQLKCYDIVESVTDEATKQFLGAAEVAKKKDFLKAYCGLLDALAEALDAETFSAEVDDVSMDIILSVSCPEFVVEGKDHPLYGLLGNTKTFAVRKSPDVEDGVELSFRIGGIWDLR